MKRFILTCLLCAASAHAPLDAQTFHYKLDAVVKGGERTPGNGSGLFVTFTADGCYDSDKDGNTMGNGFQRLHIKGSDRISYKGSSYWGDADYIFAADYSVLNVRADDNVYIYSRGNAEAGKTVSTYVGVRKERSPGASVSFPGGLPGGSAAGNARPAPARRPKGSSRHGDAECPSCHRSGRCGHCGGKGWKEIEVNLEYRKTECPICRGTGKCLTCHGRGVIHY